MSAALEVFETGLEEAILSIDGIADAPTGVLMEGIGRLVQEQTRRRITSEKTAPDGSAWKENRAGTSTLYASGALADSIDYVASTGSVIVGTGLIYARIHQEGGVIKPVNGQALKFWWVSGGFTNFVVARSVTIPRRQYMGLSADNQNEIVEATEDWYSRLVQ